MTLLTGDSTERHERRPSWRLRLDTSDKNKVGLTSHYIHTRHPLFSISASTLKLRRMLPNWILDLSCHVGLCSKRKVFQSSSALGTDNITLYKKYVAKLVIHYTGKCHKVLSFEYIEFRNNAEQQISNFQLNYKLDFHSFSNTLWENLFMYLTKQQTIKCFHFFIHSFNNALFKDLCEFDKTLQNKELSFCSSIHSTIH